jgi:SAM-dependent MidA family methyltransferase
MFGFRAKSAMMVGVEDIRERIHREGPLPFSTAVEIALYGPNGFYTQGGGAGRSRDFVTSPEVGSLFGAVVARALDTWWLELGKPDPFFVAECGAGPGTLAQSVLRANPICATALRYLLIDSSEAMRTLHRSRKLPLVDSSEIFAAVAFSAEQGDDDDDVVSLPNQGPLCASLEGIPAVPIHVILANELLDNIAFDIVARTDLGWDEIRVAINPVTDRLETIAVEADGPLAHWGYRFAPAAVPGQIVPIAQLAAQWVADAFEQLSSDGRIVCIDYGAPTALLADRGDEWLRTYRDHQRTYGIDAVLQNMGSSDITIDVPVDQLPVARSIKTQASFLKDHGIDELVAEAKRSWTENAAVGDLAALQARSWISEAGLLTDPNGLGAFVVLEWRR